MAGCQERFEVEETLPACQLKPAYRRELDDPLQERVKASPCVVGVKGQQEWLEPWRYTRTKE